MSHRPSGFGVRSVAGRLLRLVAAGVCLLYLTACVGTAWLWDGGDWGADLLTLELHDTGRSRSTPGAIRTRVCLSSALGTLGVDVTRTDPPSTLEEPAGPVQWVATVEHYGDAGRDLPSRDADDVPVDVPALRGAGPFAAWDEDRTRDWGRWLYDARPVRSTGAAVPGWFAVAVFAVPPLAWIGILAGHFARRRKRARGPSAGRQGEPRRPGGAFAPTAVAAAVLLCAATAGLWARSIHRPAELTFRRPDGWYTVRSAAGRLTVLVPPRPGAVPGVRTDDVRRWADELDVSESFPGAAAARGGKRNLMAAGPAATPQLLLALDDPAARRRQPRC